MYSQSKLLFKSIVKPFYSEYYGAFIFVFTMLFYIVGQIEDAGLLEFHYSLIMGMFQSNQFLSLVLSLWFLYALNCSLFVIKLFSTSEYAWLQVYNELSKLKRIFLFLIVEFWLMLPILLYAVAVVVIGWKEGHHHKMLLVIFLLLLFSMASSFLYVFKLQELKENRVVRNRKVGILKRLKLSYPSILIRFVFNHLKASWISVKVLSCSLFYLIARNNTAAGYDTDYIFGVFNFSILTNGVIIYKMRNFEEQCLSFYRGMEVSKLKRYLHYSIVFVLLLVPEVFMAGYLAPKHLTYGDAANIVLSGLSLLMLVHSITYLQHLRISDFIKMLMFLLGLQYLLFMVAGMIGVYLTFLIGSISCFSIGYYRFEQSTE